MLDSTKSKLNIVSMLTLYHCATSPSLLIEYFGLGGVSRKRLSSAYTHNNTMGFNLAWPIYQHISTQNGIISLINTMD
jgi:hypothetical protein